MPLSPSQRLTSINDLLLYRLGRLSSVAGAMVVRLCEGGYGITRREWGVVAQLYENGSLPPSELATLMQRDRARTSRTLTSLVHKKLVLRTTPAHDRRSARVELSPKGVQLYEALMPQIQVINSQILAALPPDSVTLFDKSLDSLQVRAASLLAELSPDLPKANRRMGQRGKDSA